MSDPAVHRTPISPTAGLDAGVAPEGLRLVTPGNRPAGPPTTSTRVVRGGGTDIARRFRRNWPAMAGLVILAVIVVLSLVVPFFPATGGGPEIASRFLPPRVPLLESFGILDGSRDGVDAYAAANLPPGTYFLFGTDELGRDVWSRVWSGTRVSLLIAVIAFAIDVVIGMTYGLVSGYFGGRTDSLMQRVVEVLSGIPQLVIVTLFVVAVGPGIGAIVFGLLLSNWLAMSRVSRAQALRQKTEEYVLASRTLGARDARIVFVEILPNIIGPIVTMSMFSIPSAIFTESYLSFVGLGVQAPMASLGSLVSVGYKSFLAYPFLVIVPVVVLGLLMVAFTLVADGLKEATDPRLTTSRGH
ncbi:ABC transporter permease subunit [Rathayibacter festucae]|uniref:ABC transporter permease subunit n=1 Tax=Rathayibacter festucae TaxID=110937 RepID=A0ABX6GVG4_9MICO|nr:ABC transporter permease [Rathayibacter festucae]QHC61407.1 ABC transporter permease subunit [Rathayibacter festucae]